MYHKALPMPMVTHKFGAQDSLAADMGVGVGISPGGTEDDSGQFVSSVCWRGASKTLLAANSLGTIKVMAVA